MDLKDKTELVIEEGALSPYDTRELKPGCVIGRAPGGRIEVYNNLENQDLPVAVIDGVWGGPSSIQCVDGYRVVVKEMKPSAQPEEYHFVVDARSGRIISGLPPSIPANDECEIVVDLRDGDSRPMNITAMFVMATVRGPGGTRDVMAKKHDSVRGRISIPLRGPSTENIGMHTVHVLLYDGGGVLETVARFKYFVCDPWYRGEGASQ